MRARCFSSPRHLFPLLVLGAVALAVPAIAQTSGQPAPTPQLATYPACNGQPSKDDSDVAHGAYIAGKRAFDENDYPTALQYFRDALKRDCTKYELLNIISRAYELQGNRPEAINALEVYLKRAPANDPGAEPIQRRIANLKAQQAAADASAKSAASASAPTATTTATAAPPPSATGTTEPPPAAPDRGHSAAPWILVGVGGAALVTGIVLLAVGENDISGAPAICGPLDVKGDCTLDGNGAKSQQNTGNTLAAVGGIVGGVGVVAVIGGLIWHFAEPTGPDTSAPKTGKLDVHPDARPGYAGLSVGGTF